MPRCGENIFPFETLSRCGGARLGSLPNVISEENIRRKVSTTTELPYNNIFDSITPVILSNYGCIWRICTFVLGEPSPR
jgi:hypothetical protein